MVVNFEFILMYIEDMRVEPLPALEGTRFMLTMLRIEEQTAAGAPSASNPRALEVLEEFHKITVIYMMSFRGSI